MQDWVQWWPRGGVGPCEALWRAVRGVYVGQVAETRARRWWSRRDREVARKSLRLIELRAKDHVGVIARQVEQEMFGFSVEKRSWS